MTSFSIKIFGFEIISISLGKIALFKQQKKQHQKNILPSKIISHTHDNDKWSQDEITAFIKLKFNKLSIQHCTENEIEILKENIRDKKFEDAIND